MDIVEMITYRVQCMFFHLETPQEQSEYRLKKRCFHPRPVRKLTIFSETQNVILHSIWNFQRKWVWLFQGEGSPAPIYQIPLLFHHPSLSIYLYQSLSIFVWKLCGSLVPDYGLTREKGDPARKQCLINSNSNLIKFSYNYVYKFLTYVV